MRTKYLAVQRQLTLSIALMFILLLLTACGQGSIDPNSIGNLAEGREIFKTGSDLIGTPCLGCHSHDGSSLEGENAEPSMEGIAETAGNRTDQSAEDYLRDSIINPDAYIVDSYRNTMEQGYQYLLSEEDIDNLVAFMLTQ